MSENLIASSNFFRPKSPLKFWESCRHSQRHTNCFLFCWTVIEYFAKIENRPEAPWDRLSHLALLYIEYAYVNRVDIEKVIDGFSSEKVRSKFFFQPIFIPNNVIDLFWMLSRKYISEFCAFQRES